MGKSLGRYLPLDKENVPSEPTKFGKYSVLDRLGKGAFGVVYRCSDPDLDRMVAVKVLLAADLAAPELLERFSRESRAAAKLSHPNIVAVYDAGVEAGKPYLVMEYVAGRTLDQMMDADEWDTQSVLQLIYRLADALCYSHELGVLHRDIKPANVLVDERGRPKLADFGLARLADDARWLSATGDILGTPRYMSPEQALLPSDEVDTRADIYSLGAVFYELLTGRPLVDGPTPLATLKALTDGKPVPLKDIRPDLPMAIIDLCERMIEKDRARRTQSAQEVISTIDSILDGRVVPSTDIIAFSRFPIVRKSNLAESGPSNSQSISTLSDMSHPAVRSTSSERPYSSQKFIGWIVASGVLGLTLLAASLYLNRVASLRNSQDAYSAVPPNQATVEVVKLLSKRAADLHQIRDDALYHSQLSEIREELNSLIRRDESNWELRRLRAELHARNGDYQWAIDDWDRIPADRHDTASRRTLLQTRATWYLLLRSALVEGALRPSNYLSLELERNRLEMLDGSDMESARSRSIAKSIGLVMHPPELGDPTELPPVDLPKTDVAFAVVHTWRSSYSLERASILQYLLNQAPEEEKDSLRKRRDAWDQFAMQSIREGLEVDSHHLGLLFLRSVRWIDKVGWDSADGSQWTDAEKRNRGPFESSYQRFRTAPAKFGVEMAYGRAVILERLGQHERALDQMNEFVDRGKFSAAITAYWVWLQLNVSQDSDLDTLSLDSLLKTTDRFKEAGEPEFGIYFVRALCKSALGNWREALQEVQDGKKACNIADWESMESDFQSWFLASDQSLARFQDATVDALWKLPLPMGNRITIQMELIQSLNNSEWVEENGLDEEDTRELLATGHFRLAKMSVERDDRDGVLEHLQQCLEQHSEEYNVDRLKSDETLQSWNSDEEFQELYARYSNEEE